MNTQGRPILRPSPCSDSKISTSAYFISCTVRIDERLQHAYAVYRGRLGAQDRGPERDGRRRLQERPQFFRREVALRPDEYRRTALLRGAFAAPQRELSEDRTRRRLDKRADEARRREFLSKLEKGEAKINSAVNFPHEILYKYRSQNWNNKDVALEQMWKALPNTVGDKPVIVVRDGSGSMGSRVAGSNVSALDVATALAIYFAEDCKYNMAEP